MTGIDHPDGSWAEFVRNDAGQVIEAATSGHGSAFYGYDQDDPIGSSTSDGQIVDVDLDWVFPRAITWSGPIASVIEFDWAEELQFLQNVPRDEWAEYCGGECPAFTNLRVTGMRINGVEVPIVQDELGQDISAGDLAVVRNNPLGLPTGTSLGIITDSAQYNNFGELEAYNVNVSASPLVSASFARDKLGRITNVAESVNGLSRAIEYEYDTAGRLVRIIEDSVVVADYAYDANGNRTADFATGNAGIYDNHDRLLQYGDNSYSFNLAGNLLSKTHIASSDTTGFDYDSIGNLRAVTLPDGTAIEYLIDGSNRRVGKRVDGELAFGLIYQSDLNPVAQTDSNGNAVSIFVYATQSNVPDYLIQGGVSYRIITDHTGSPRLVVNAVSGQIVQEIEYDAFGKIVNEQIVAGFVPIPFGFAGGLHDRDTGLVRFGSRDYDPEVGRWTSKDPILFAGGDTNLYAYAANDPINGRDPTGQLGLAGCIGGAVAGGIISGVVGATADAIAQNISNPGCPIGFEEWATNIAKKGALGAATGCAVGSGAGALTTGFAAAQTTFRAVTAGIAGFAGGL